MHFQLISVGGMRWGQLKSRCQQSCVSFWRIKKIACSLVFSNFQRLLTFIGLWFSSSNFKAGSSGFSPHIVSQSCFLLCPSPIFNDYIGSTWVIQNDLSENQLISNLNFICILYSLLPCKVKFTGSRDWDMDIF